MYLEIDEGYPGHRKTLRLCALLKCDTADAFPPRLWAWAARSAPDGDLTGMEPVEVELALRWRGADGVLFAALVSAGFVDQGPNGAAQIHNWAERTGGAIEKMALRAGMAKERRAHVDGKCASACRYCAGTLTLRSPARSNQDKTSPVQTRPGQSEEQKADVPSAAFVYPKAFEEVWEGCDRKGGKGEAFKAWSKSKPPSSLVVPAWKRYVASLEDWRNPKDVSGWLNAKGWLSEYVPYVKPTGTGPAPPQRKVETFEEKHRRQAREEAAKASELRRQQERQLGTVTAGEQPEWAR